MKYFYSLNAYSLRTVSDLIDIIGSAETNSTVTVNNLTVNRHGKYWHKGLSVTNDSAAVYQSVNVVGVYNPPGTNDPDIVTTETGHVFVVRILTKVNTCSHPKVNGIRSVATLFF